MNEKKICFIWNVQSEEYYRESEKYVDSLIVPQGFEIDKVVVHDKNYAKAYNIAMTSSDAKYKVYLQDTIFIINKKFIHDFLQILQDDEVGLVGILGAKTIPTSGIWQESRHKVGKQYLGNSDKIESIAFGDVVVENYEEVKALDGVLLVSQQDILWRQDIFTGRYYYDSAQCAEFAKQGYKLVVANQENPWCLHDVIEKDSKEEFETSREHFLDEYSSDIYPLVSILLPTYNRPEYFQIALESALNQTYKNIEIIVGDNSTNVDTKELIQKYLEKYNCIKYINNGGNIRAESWIKIYQNSKGQFINFLMDDDLFHPEKIRLMMNYYLEYNNISLVTSYRQLIDEKGKSLPDRVATQKLFDKDTIINGRELARYMLFSTLNVIGEPTTTLVRKSDIDGRIGNFMGKTYMILTDITQWLESLKKGDAVYIAETLSYFRQHGGQDQRRPYYSLLGAIDRFNFIHDSFKEKLYIYNENEYLKLLDIWYKSNKEYIEQLDDIKKDPYFDENKVQVYITCIEEAKEILNKSIIWSSI